MAEGLNTSLFANSALQCYYRFVSGNLTSDSKNSLTLSGSGSPTDTTGKYGNGVSLDTSSSYSRSTSLTTDGESFSINMWVKDADQALFSAKSSGYEYYIQNRQDLSIVAVHLEFTSGTGDYSVSHNATWNNSKWGMITNTIEQSGSDIIVKIYLNAELVKNETVSGKTIKGLVSPYHICKFEVEGKSTSYGKFDDIMFFKNKILTQAEVNELYIDYGGSFIFNMI